MGSVKDLITVNDAERRILRACKTVRVVPDREQRFLRYSGPAYVKSIVQDFRDAYNSDEAKNKFRPTPADISDMLTALSWANILAQNEWRYIWWRSFDISFGVIAGRIGRSDETARKRYRDAILKVWYEANQKAAA